jgi:hypothetical protein
VCQYCRRDLVSAEPSEGRSEQRKAGCFLKWLLGVVTFSIVACGVFALSGYYFFGDPLLEYLQVVGSSTKGGFPGTGLPEAGKSALDEYMFGEYALGAVPDYQIVSTQGAAFDLDDTRDELWCVTLDITHSKYQGERHYFVERFYLLWDVVPAISERWFLRYGCSNW